jgi:hypothetical protein
MKKLVQVVEYIPISSNPMLLGPILKILLHYHDVIITLLFVRIFKIFANKIYTNTQHVDKISL